MLRPPEANNLSHAQAGRRHRAKRVRRAVLVQCAGCGCKGTGMAERRLYATNLPSDRNGSRLIHRGCGGLLVAFDTEEGTL